MIFKKDELKLLWPFYLSSFIHGLSLGIFAFIVIYFRELGLSFFQISITTTAFAFAMVFFEIPTGAFADGVSRKYSVIIGYGMLAITTFLMALTNSFNYIIILWILAGIGVTFTSGAYDAWVVDNLIHKKRKDLQQEFFIKEMSIMSIGAVFAPLLGAIIVKISSIQTLWYVFSAGCAVSLIILAIFAKEHYVPKKKSAIQTIKQSYHDSIESLQYSFNHKVIFYIMMGGAFVSIMLFSNDGWQPFLVSLSLPKENLGLVMSAFGFISIVIPFLARYLVKYKVRIMMPIIVGIMMLVMGSVLLLAPPMYIHAIIIYLIIQILFIIKNPVMQSYFHDHVPKHLRATIGSTTSMMTQLAVGLSALFAGYLMDLYGPQKAIAMGGIFGFFAIFFYLRIKD